jgi:hypothetical protein
MTREIPLPARRRDSAPDNMWARKREEEARTRALFGPVTELEG